MTAIDIIQGANWGSEAKGAVAGYMAVKEDYDFAVRTGAINAGHTVYYKGKPYVNQQLPVAWVNPRTKLVIGPGAYVHIPTILKEIRMIKEATGRDPSKRIYIDRRAGVHFDFYAGESADVDRHHKIGATGKGCAEAILHKIKDRGDRDLLLSSYVPPGEEVWRWEDDTSLMLTKAYDDGARICLEGTQGEHLDFHLGEWPYVTSRQTTPAAWVAEAGLSPSLRYRIILVARAYPIRVAGNSGPMPLETTWPLLARKINARLDEQDIGDHPMRVSETALIQWEAALSLIGESVGMDLYEVHNWTPEDRIKYQGILSDYSTKAQEMLPKEVFAELRKLFEYTTVTKKLRRISRPDWYLLGKTVKRLKPGMVVLTFLNYEYPELYGRDTVHTKAASWVKTFCHDVSLVNTGPEPGHFVWI